MSSRFSSQFIIGISAAIFSSFLTLKSSLSFAVYSSQPLPVITSEQLSVGNQWIWDYYEGGDLTKLYSSERYTVVKRKDSIVTIDLWTLYANASQHTLGANQYTPSARFVVDLNNCFAAFKGPKKREFKIQVYTYEKNNWGSVGYDVPSTAFEEKFNCNPHLYDSAHADYETVYEKEQTPFGEWLTFQQKPKRNSQIQSFYFVDHPQLKGVAYRKRFNPLSPYEFEMRLSHFETKAFF